MTTQSGQPVIIYGQSDETCQRAPYFDWIKSNVITRMPRHSTLSDGGVVEQESQTCGGKVVPVTAIAYTSDPSFTGTDTVTFGNKETVIIDVEAGQPIQSASTMAKVADPAETQPSTEEAALTSASSIRTPDELSPLIGNWEGSIHTPDWSPGHQEHTYPGRLRLQIEEQDAQTLRGHASASGASQVSCEDSNVTLIPDYGNNYSVTFTGGGCNSKGKLKHQGDT